MNLAAALSVVAATLTAGSSSAGQVIGVAEILARCDTYKGKSVQAAGYLAACAGYDCDLYADKAGERAFVQASHDVVSARRQGHTDLEVGLLGEALDRMEAIWPIGIAGSDAFDRKAAPFQHSYVVITGRVDDGSCTGMGGTDRSYGIRPTDIRTWTPAEGAPAN